MSEVWNHFYMAPNGLSVNCNHCGKFMKRSDSSTKSMWGHLKAFHADLVGEETFRLKRTRRMRGSSGTTSAKKSGKKGTKKGQQKAAQQRRLAAETAASGSSSSGSSSEEACEEDERQSEFSGTSSRGTTPAEQPAAATEGAETTKTELTEKSLTMPIHSLLELNVAELEKNEKEKEMLMATTKPEEPVETPTQPYVKRKRHQQQNVQQVNQPHGQTQQHPPSAEQHIPIEAAHSLMPAPKQEKEEKSSPQIVAASSSPAPAAQPKKRSPSPSPTSTSPQTMNPSAAPPGDIHVHHHHQAQGGGGGIPHSGNHSAFSKYSTAALLQQAQEGGKKSPAHGAEAPKSRAHQAQSQQQQQHRTTAYGLEAMTGLNGQQLSMLGLADPQLLAQLETAAAMSQLVQMQQQIEKQSFQQQQQPKCTQTQQNERALNELLALYAASAATAQALQQQQQQDGLKAKTTIGQTNNQQQQQQLAAQQAAAAAWLYNWEWMAAAQRMGAGTQQQQQNGQMGLGNLLGQQLGGKGAFGIPNGASTTNLPPTPTTTPMKANNGTTNGNQMNSQQQNATAAAAAAMAAALGISLNGTTNGQQKTKNGQQTADAMLAKAAMSQLLIQAQQIQTTATKQQSNGTNVAQAKVEQTQQPNQAQKRKSPTTTTNEEAVATNSLQVLADTAASTAAVESRMQQREETGGSPPKHARKENAQQSTMTLGEREKALAESLVLYGMHRIAMELQLSYSVHANKGKAEYAFYCANGTNGNANIQRMVTLTESQDQILHIREYANGAVVAEECWPKNAEPYNLLSSLRDKCQRRLCSAQ